MPLEKTSRSLQITNLPSEEARPRETSGYDAITEPQSRTTPRPTLHHDGSGRVVVVYAAVVVPARKTVLMFVASQDAVLDLPHEMLRERETAHDAARRALANGAGISEDYPLQEIVSLGRALRETDKRDSRPLLKYVWLSLIHI